mmetsp:Transcript_80898/g.147578  ORF Transcript_80898/g.147578 Transcript_80898/m.147578 type:complete len:246 (-) Transcript_80898:146-883(-)
MVLPFIRATTAEILSVLAIRLDDAVSIRCPAKPWLVKLTSWLVTHFIPFLSINIWWELTGTDRVVRTSGPYREHLPTLLAVAANGPTFVWVLASDRKTTIVATLFRIICLDCHLTGTALESNLLTTSPISQVPLDRSSLVHTINVHLGDVIVNREVTSYICTGGSTHRGIRTMVLHDVTRLASRLQHLWESIRPLDKECILQALSLHVRHTSQVANTLLHPVIIKLKRALLCASCGERLFTVLAA